MGLELVSGSAGQGRGGESRAGDEQGGGGGSGSNLAAQLAEAERQIAGARQRLQMLAERAADLRLRLQGEPNPAEPKPAEDDGGSPR